MERVGHFLNGKREMGSWRLRLGVLAFSLLFFGNLMAQSPTTSDWQDQDNDGNIDQVLLTFSVDMDVTDGSNGLDCIEINGGVITFKN